jgi:alpha-galactosidase
MESFANENQLFAPMKAWAGGVPFGWNSWGVTNYQNNISYDAAIAVSDSIHTNLQAFGFTNGGTVYVNLDSFWNNLWTDYGGTQLQEFVAHCHANGQKAGIYFIPFAFFGNPNDATNYWVPVGYPPNYSLYRFSDILLRDTNGDFITNDNALAIDPTHPGTQGYIDYYTYWFTNWGFDYVKLDYLSHGSLEGVHYDPSVTTGIQAYNQGMQYLLNDLPATMFTSESISPIFPYQYAHCRRIACDAEVSEIINTAYTMNSVSLGWWISGRLYQYNDPDILVFDNGPNTNEVQSRLINGAVTGLYLNGSILTNPASVSLAQLCLTNAAINDVARGAQTFRPVDGATGTGAADILSRQDGRNWDIAVFNYNSSSANQTVNLGSAGLPAGTFVATNLWDGTTATVSNSLSVSLNSKQAKLFRLALVSPPPPPQFTAVSVAPPGNTVTLSGSNGIPGWNYLVLSSTNPDLPAAQWLAIATNTFDVNGGFTFTTGANRHLPENLYRLRLQ